MKINIIFLVVLLISIVTICKSFYSFNFVSRETIKINLVKNKNNDLPN